MNIDLKKIEYKDLGFFRFKKLNEKILLTNDYGEHVFLEEDEFRDFIEGKLNKNKKPYLSLVAKNFVKSEFDVSQSIERYRRKNDFLFNGPSLHIMVVTLRCNYKCIYCHASAQDMKKKEMDMTKKTAKESLDIIFQTPSPFVVIEFQGGEPLINWPIVKYITEEARKRNEKIGKNLEIRLISNFSLMTKERYSFLLKNNVSLCASLDGPKELHNKNRPINGDGDSHQYVAKWINIFNRDYPRLRKEEYIWKMSSIVVVSHYSLPYYKEIVDEYIKLGFSSLFFRPLNPFGFSKNVWEEITYSSEEFIEFYKKSLDYIIQLNLEGTHFVERQAKIFLEKILTDYDPNMMELRSPCGAGIGQLAYNYNGDVYTCDEGRMVSMMNDESFRIGNVKNDNYKEIVSNPVARTVCSASCLVGLAGCSDCVYAPYCGVCPIYNYFEQNNIFAQIPNNERCKIHKAILGYLFEKLQDKKIEKIFNNWLKK